MNQIKNTLQSIMEELEKELDAADVTTEGLPETYSDKIITLARKLGIARGAIRNAIQGLQNVLQKIELKNFNR